MDGDMRGEYTMHSSDLMGSFMRPTAILCKLHVLLDPTNDQTEPPVSRRRLYDFVW